MRKNDIILIIMVFLSAVVIMLFLNRVKTDGKYVVVMSEGQEYARLPLEENTQISVNGKNEVKIENGEVFVCMADCPDKLCMKQGKIKDSVKSIVCLPNKMTVKIE